MSSDDLDLLSFEIDTLTDQQPIFSNIDDRVYKYSFPCIFILLIIIRPSFLYINENNIVKFSIHKLVMYSIILYIVFIICYLFYKTQH